MSNYDEFFRVLFRDSFTEKPKNRNERILDKCTEARDTLGYCHFALVNVVDVDGKREKRPYKFMSARTFHTFFGHISHSDALWYTPNTLSTSKPLAEKRLVKIINGKPVDILKLSEVDFDHYEWFNPTSFTEGETYKLEKGGRREKYVRWINTLFVDIDKKTMSPEQILKAVAYANLPKPTVINETTNGYHLYWFLKDRVPATPKATKLYKHIIKNLILTLSSIDGVDSKTTDTCRYMQIPRNIVVSDYDRLYSFSLFRDWLNRHGISNYKQMSFEKPQKRLRRFTNDIPKTAVDRAVAVILKGVSRGKRHEACFALSCYFKHMGYSKDAARDLLLAWNKKNQDYSIDHSDAAVHATLTSVYNSPKQGLPYNIISSLSNVSLGGWYKHKKERSVRKNSHYKEWARDILLKLLSAKNKRITGSQKELAEYFKMPLSTFKVILKELKEGNFSALALNVSGRGKDSFTTISINHVLYQKNKFAFFLEFSTMDDLELEDAVNGAFSSSSTANLYAGAMGGLPFYQKV